MLEDKWHYLLSRPEKQDKLEGDFSAMFEDGGNVGT